MRNLKRALSLALASVMLLGMMVVGTSAASYSDVDDNDNVEAIEVLNAVQVMIGRQGNFEPDEAVNRHEMAVIMAKLYLGVEAADSYVGSHPFTDVVPWADKYVAACYENGLVAGTSATTFSGGNPLTAVQAAAMMLRALGYKDLSKGADNWSVPVTAMANQIRLFAGVASNPSEKLNRNQVAQLALNTLKSPMVNLKDNTISWSNDEGQLIMTGGSREYIVLSSREAYAYAINDVESSGNSASGINGATVELGEHLYNGKLRLNNYDRDVFQRPARTWEYDGKEIGTYVKEELLRKTYTDKVTGRDLYELLTPNTIDKYDFVIAFDGETSNTVLSQVTGADQNPYFTYGNLVRTNTETIGRTGKGVTTEVYVDTNADRPTVYIVVINTFVAKAREDYNTKDGDIDMTVYGVDFVASNTALVKDTTDSDSIKNGKQPFTEVLSPAGEDFEMLKDAKKNDLFLVNVAGGEIQVMWKPEILSAVNLTAFSKGSYVITGGEKYEYNNTALYDPDVLDAYTSTNNGAINLKDLTYNVVLDDYGYLIGVERIEDPTQYVFITGTDGGYSDLNSARTSMRAIFTDGTTDVIDVNMVKSDTIVRNTFRNMGPIINTWCTYTVDNNNVYTLNTVPLSIGNGKIAQWAQNAQNTANNGKTAGARGDSSYTIDKGHVSLVANNGENDIRVYGNDKTIYISADMTIINAKTKLDKGTGTTLTSTGNGLTNGIGYGASTSNDTNYISVNPSTVPNNPRTAVISDVDAVTVGVANANIKAVSLKEADLEKELDNGDRTDTVGDGDLIFPKNEIYTLYNSDGVVIAAVVLGDDQGTSTKIATFTTNEPSAEAWVEETSNGRATTSKGHWTWSREAIVDGEVVTLTESGDNLSQLAPWNSATQTGHAKGDTAEVRFDADGNVRRADNLTKINGGTSANGEFRNGIYKYTTDIQSVEKSAESNDTVVLYADYTSGAKLVYSNGTLFRDTTATKGVYVNGANIIVANAKLKNNATGTPGVVADVDQFKTITNTYTGTDAMSDALNAMDDNFHGTLIIVVKDHVAQSVILNNTYGKKVNTGDTTPVNPNGKYDAISGSGSSYVYRYYDPTNKLTAAEIKTQAADALSAYFGGATVLRNGMGLTGNQSGIVALKRYDGDLIGEQITLSVQRVVAAKLSDGTVLSYLDAVTNMSTAALKSIKGLTSGTTYLIDCLAYGDGDAITAAPAVPEWIDAASDTYTFGSAVNLTAGKDITLYPAYDVALGAGVTADYKKLDNTTATLAAGDTYNIARGTALTLKATGATVTTKTYAFTETVGSNDPTNIDQKKGTASGISTTYNVDKAATLDVTAGGTAIKVKNDKGEITEMVATGSETLQQIATKIGLTSGKQGGYFVDTDRLGTAVEDADVTKVSVATTMSNTIGTVSDFLQDGHTYEFGYWKIKAAAVTTTDIGGSETTGTWTAEGVSGNLTAAKNYFVKDGAKVVCMITHSGDTGFAGKTGGGTVKGSTGAVAKVEGNGFAVHTGGAGTQAVVNGGDATQIDLADGVTYKNGSISFTWTIAADDTSLAITVTNS